MAADVDWAMSYTEGQHSINRGSTFIGRGSSVIDQGVDC
jgi:hypothetical protein